MTIEANLFELQSNSNVNAGWDEETMDFVINLEVLRDCVHACPGCFVNRRNSIDDVDLDKALELAYDFHNKGMRFREVVISPTDIFSASNAIEVLDNPKFQELLKIHPKTRITTTAMFHKVDWKQWHDVFAILDDETKYRKDMIIELLVPMDIDLLLNRDEQYYSDFSKALNYLANDTTKIMDWSFAVNVHYDETMISKYQEITTIVREDFNTIIEFLPSFFRTGNDSLISKHIETWKHFLRSTITKENHNEMVLTIAEPYHNAINTIVVNYKKNQMYISPFIYEQILFEYPSLATGSTANEVMETIHRLNHEQLQYAAKTHECSNCEFLTTCVGRNVLSFMEAKEITTCVFPKDVMQLYPSYNASALPPSLEQRANNN